MGLLSKILFPYIVIIAYLFGFVKTKDRGRDVDISSPLSKPPAVNYKDDWIFGINLAVNVSDAFV